MMVLACGGGGWVDAGTKIGMQQSSLVDGCCGLFMQLPGSAKPMLFLEQPPAIVNTALHQKVGRIHHQLHDATEPAARATPTPTSYEQKIPRA